MPIKKAPVKKAASPLIRPNRVPFVRPLRRTSPNYYSHSFVAFMTVLVMISIEAFFGYPSKWFDSGNTSKEKDQPLYEEIIIEGCTKEYVPVCGIDGNTYGNMCELDVAKVTLAYKGKCKIEKPKEQNTGSTSQTGAVPAEIPSNQVNPDTLVPQGSGEVIPVTFQTYKNTIFDYELSLPKYAFYRGYATGDKKGHTLAVDLKDENTSNFSTALVRVSYTKVGNPIPIGSKMTLSLEKGTLSIDYDEPLVDKAKEIVDAITSTARSIDE